MIGSVNGDDRVVKLLKELIIDNKNIYGKFNVNKNHSKAFIYRNHYI